MADFNKLFKACTNNELLAYKLLTPDVMEKFVKIKNKALDHPRYVKEPTYYVEKQPDDVVEIDYDGVLYYVANHIIIPQKAHVYQPLELE